MVHCRREAPRLLWGQRTPVKEIKHVPISEYEAPLVFVKGGIIFFMIQKMLRNCEEIPIHWGTWGPVKVNLGGRRQEPPRRSTSIDVGKPFGRWCNSSILTRNLPYPRQSDDRLIDDDTVSIWTSPKTTELMSTEGNWSCWVTRCWWNRMEPLIVFIASYCNVVCGICSPCRNQIHGYDFSSSHPIADGFQEPPSCESPKHNTPDVKIYTAKVLHTKVLHMNSSPRAQNVRRLACCPSISQIQLDGV